MMQRAETLTDHLIRFAAETPHAAAVEMMQLSLLDWAACGIAGAQEADFAGFKALNQSDGPASLFGGGTASAPQAALVNGTLSHALDYDDTHFAHIGHPSVAVLPAVLALAEANGQGFEEVLNAATIGVEASIHVGLWLGRDHYQVGYHQTATAGAFGAVLAAGRLLGLSDARMRHALGLCTSMASGVKAQFGTMGKPLNAGLAARTGVEAALWAEAGVTAADDGLAGPLGFGETHHGAGAAVTPGAMPWQLLSISHKYHACCHGLHAMLEALRGVQDPPGTIAALRIRTHPRWMTVCNMAAPDTGLAAKFSYAQTAAMHLLGHDTGAIDNFTDAMTQDADIRALRALVEVTPDDALSETQAQVTLVLQDGTERDLHHDLMSPIPLETRRAKLMGKAVALLGEARAEDLCLAVDQANLSRLIRSISR